jgi:hypothetical protein
MSISRSFAASWFLSIAAASQPGCGPGNDPAAADAATAPDACVGLGCSVVDCRSQGLPSTSVSGTVFAPNGTLPLFGVTVYVPFTDPGPWLPA